MNRLYNSFIWIIDTLDKQVFHSFGAGCAWQCKSCTRVGGPWNFLLLFITSFQICYHNHHCLMYICTGTALGSSCTPTWKTENNFFSSSCTKEQVNWAELAIDYCMCSTEYLFCPNWELCPVPEPESFDAPFRNRFPDLRTVQVCN